MDLQAPAASLNKFGLEHSVEKAGNGIIRFDVSRLTIGDSARDSKKRKKGTTTNWGWICLQEADSVRVTAFSHKLAELVFAFNYPMMSVAKRSAR